MPALDPNGTLETPTYEWVWLAPDWSASLPSGGEKASKAPQPGWTNVKTRVTKYNDGRQVTQVLDENGNPVSGPNGPLDIKTDPKQAAVYNTQVGDTSVAGQQTHVQINPATGQPELATIYPGNPNVTYAPATAQQLQQAGFTGRTEGTRRPDGTYDNEQPVWVVRGPPTPEQPGGVMVGQPRALTDDERKAWNLSRQMARNPGGLSDADLRAQQTATKREPIKDRPGYSTVTTVNPQTSQTETHVEKDGAPGVVVQLPPGQAPSRTNPTNNHFEELDEATGRWIDRGPIQKTPTIRPNPVTGEDEQIQEVPDGKGGVKLIRRPIESQGGDASTPSDAPNVDLSDPQRAYDSFMQLYQWATSKVSRGEKTPQWLENILKGPHTAVSTVLDREKEMTRRAENTQSNQLTQRSQDVTLSGNRLSNATSGFNTAQTAASDINKLAGAGNNAYYSTLLGTLALQRLNAQGMGGLGDIPPVVPGPLGQPGTPMPGLPGSALPGGPPIPAPYPPRDPNGGPWPGIRTGAAMTGTGVDAPVNRGAVQPAFMPPPPISGAAVGGPTPGEPGGPPLQTTYPTYSPPYVNGSYARPTVPLPSALPPADEFGRTPASGGAVTPSPSLAPVTGPASELGQPGDPGYGGAYGGPSPAQAPGSIYRDLPTVPGMPPPVPLPGGPPGGWPDTGLPPPVPMPDFPGQPQTMTPGGGAVGMPMMAMAASRMGADPYAAARDALRRLGISDEDIMHGHRAFLGG